MSDNPRIISPDRVQTYWDEVNLEAWLPQDHQARSIWAFVQSVDLSKLYNKIQARGSHAGRPATDPALLLALWLLAVSEGIGSARELDRRVRRDLPFMWMAGGVPVNYHGLADFRTSHEEVLDTLLTDSLTALVWEGLVDFDTVLADGTKVRANAGRDSYQTEERLLALETEVRAHIKRLKDDNDDDSAGPPRRAEAARKRAAKEHLQRIAKARATLDKIEGERDIRNRKYAPDSKRRERPQAQASTTDPDARKMRFNDNSFGPGFNVQIASTKHSGIILSAHVTDRRNDMGAGSELIQDIKRRYNLRPKNIICDTTYILKEEIIDLDEEGVLVWTPPRPDNPKSKPASVKKREKKRAEEPPALKNWRARMASEAGKTAMKARKRIELTNAHLKNKGMRRFTLRGLRKTNCQLLLHVLAHNLKAAQTLRKQLSS